MVRCGGKVLKPWFAEQTVRWTACEAGRGNRKKNCVSDLKNRFPKGGKAKKTLRKKKTNGKK